MLVAVEYREVRIHDGLLKTLELTCIFSIHNRVEFPFDLLQKLRNSERFRLRLDNRII